MHTHVSKVLDWGMNEKYETIATRYGCTGCDATGKQPFKDDTEEVAIDHSNCETKPCFGCKAKSLQLATGDAAGNIIASGTTQKKWDKELDLYKQARAQGIQPDGTSTKQIQKSIDVSNRTGVAYDASSPLRGIA